MTDQEKPIPEEHIYPNDEDYPDNPFIKCLRLAVIAYRKIFDIEDLKTEDRDTIARMALSMFINEQRTKQYQQRFEKPEEEEDEPATEKQIAFMKKLKVKIPEDCTKDQASQILDKKFKRR